MALRLSPSLINRILCPTSTENVRFLCNSKAYPKRIFSGIQPTGSLHLGNYLGAIVQWVKLQEEENEMFLSVVDLHSMTLPFDPKTLSRNILELTATLLGCGIDPKKVVLFQQSTVPQHTELMWHLGCISTMARLGHLPQFKEKSADLTDIPLGLYIYPVLQAADILLYKGTHIPVGEDQLQHIQLTQDLARMFNSRYGQTFPIPHSLIVDSKFNRLRSLRDPSKKMSKSDLDSKSKICLLDKEDDIVRNIKKAITDFTSQVTYDEVERPGVSNLINIHSFVTNKSIEQICIEAEHLDTGRYKLVVAEALVEYLKPIQNSIANFLKDKGYLMDVLQDGGNKACELAEQTLTEVRRNLGISFKSQSKRKKLAKL